MRLSFSIEAIPFSIVSIRKKLMEHKHFEKALVNTANRVKSETADFIDKDVKRQPSTKTLSDAIRKAKVEVDVLGDEISVSVVPIADLELKAPYWYVVNYGKKASGEEFVPKASIGYFPGHTPPEPGHTGNEVWTETGDTKNDFLMRPMDFTPLNYIEHAHNIMSSIWKNEFDKSLKATVRKMKK